MKGSMVAFSTVHNWLSKDLGNPVKHPISFQFYQAMKSKSWGTTDLDVNIEWSPLTILYVKGLNNLSIRQNEVC